MFSDNHHKKFVEMKEGLIHTVDQASSKISAECVANKLLKNGVEMELGTALIQGTPKEVTDAMLKLSNSLDTMVGHLQSKVKNLREVKTILQESGDAKLSPDLIKSTLDICTEGLHTDPVYSEVAKNVGRSMKTLCDNWGGFGEQ